MICFNVPIQNTRIEKFAKGDHDWVCFDGDITYFGGDTPIVSYYLVVNSDLFPYSTNMVGIIISIVFLCFFICASVSCYISFIITTVTPFVAIVSFETAQLTNLLFYQ